jgi:glycerol-3-phosphate dehydrogenase
MTSLSGEVFDVLVIGGGITGCGVARDAAMRGLRVALVEREDFASGTSGRSSRLVHGGIRYLEHGQFHLVHEAIRERQTLLRIAPHLVRPLGFTWPIYRGARVGRLKLGAGLWLYDLMAAGRSRRHSSLDSSATLEREPSLRPSGLDGGAVYFDAATDDTRLTLANALAARDNGAVVVNHAMVTSIHRDGESFEAVIDRDGTAETARARVVVNATGVWENSFSSDERSRRLRGSKGIHISVPRARIANREALTLISPVDGRVMFCLPAGGHTIIGTTDTWTNESPEQVQANVTDVRYLLDSANHYFPAAELNPDDVVSAWAGIRPLASGRKSANPTSISREHSIAIDDLGVINVTGGKLTTYRSMAAEVVDAVEKALGRRPRRSPTDWVLLPGGEREVGRTKIYNGDPALAAPLLFGLPYTGADLVYAVKQEMALTLSDLLIRRTHVAFETRDHGQAVSVRAAEIVAPLLGWSEDVKSARLRAYRSDVERMFTIAPA